MKFKIDTKEKFHVITPINENLSDNLTAELVQTATSFLQKDIKNVVVNLKHVLSIDDAAAVALVKVGQTFYESNASFVLCELNPSVEDRVSAADPELRNVTPSESEAWDIVQMEEIERELLDGFDNTNGKD